MILDEGWAVARKMDLFQIVPEIDLKELVAYAKTRNVSLILWAGYNSFNADVERVCKHYSEMGIKGFKVDFMDRDDQLMVDFSIVLQKLQPKQIADRLSRNLQTGWIATHLSKHNKLRGRLRT